MWELTKSMTFEAAHSLARTSLGAAGEEIHGHSFRAEVAIRGVPDAQSGMVVDLGLLEQALSDVRRALDHRFLNRVEGLGVPTLENLARFVWDRVQHCGRVTRVTIYRDSLNEACSYFGDGSA
jgi:6-pyruvoyltetrahydropterin/6-carboxytetrahydropterin synthase